MISMLRSSSGTVHAPAAAECPLLRKAQMLFPTPIWRAQIYADSMQIHMRKAKHETEAKSAVACVQRVGEGIDYKWYMETSWVMELFWTSTVMK